ANNNSSSLPSQGLSNNLPRNSGPQQQQQQQRNHSTRSSSSSSSSRPEFDLSWVQPVYVAKKRTDNDNNGVNGNKISTTTTTSEPKLQLNAFKADPTIDLFPVPSTNRTFNRSILSSDQNRSDLDEESSTELHLEDRLEAFSAALANVTFSLREEQTCPSRRHLFLGQMLLLGLFLSSVMGIAFVPSSNWLTCTLIRAGLGVCFAIVYGTLLVKAVFLLSLHSGVYLSAEYQALLLFFIISTQVAIDGQWLIHRSSSIVVDYMDGYGHAVYRCDHSVNQLLLSLLYVMILIVLIAIMAFRVRGYRENHGEALFLGITATATILLWLVWIAGTITSTPHYRDGFVAFGLVCNATLIFIIMFLPKGRQLAAVGREGPGGNNHHLDDRDQLSTASSPSIYTPSFLHLKSPVSQLMVPLGGGKPSIAGLSSVVSGNGGGLSSTGNGINGGSHFGGGGGGYHHLYKQFQGTGTTLTSPMSTTGGPPPTINTSSAIPNSYSSHALFSSAKNNSNSNNHDHEEDPNYSNLSNVFTSIAGNNHLPSPISENNSSSTGVGGG
ncbi:PREDICTED: uncharacterized protein LOC108381795, partial [Rhagoletis zephyria]|uniref:uncharacterized protein LOC108381795 n=1 Tax=Rhagoletis zephyria TaxID=28612 RepID=UPI0008112E2E